MFNLWKGRKGLKMGCHTWIYKKIKEIPQEEMRKNVLDAIIVKETNGEYSDEARDKWEHDLERTAKRYLEKLEALKATEGTTQKDIDKFGEQYGYIIAYADKLHREMMWNGRMEKYNEAKKIALKCIENGDYENVKFHKACKTLNCTMDDYQKVGDDWYVLISTDFPFRAWKYPSETFTDCEELLKFLKSHVDKFGDDVVTVYDEDGGFGTNGYTDKLETTLRAFWEQHNNALFVEFG